MNAGTTGASYGAYGRPEVTTGLGIVEVGTDALALAVDCVDPNQTVESRPSNRYRPDLWRKNAFRSRGLPDNSNLHAHHIVARTDDEAQRARDVLDRFGIDVNGTENSALLPKNAVVAVDYGGKSHANIHDTTYYQDVNTRLENLTSREQVLAELQQLREELETPGLP